MMCYSATVTKIEGRVAGRKPVFEPAMTAAARMRRSRALRRSALARITDGLAQAPTATPSRRLAVSSGICRSRAMNRLYS